MDYVTHKKPNFKGNKISELKAVKESVVAQFDRVREYKSAVHFWHIQAWDICMQLVRDHIDDIASVNERETANTNDVASPKRWRTDASYADKKRSCIVPSHPHAYFGTRVYRKRCILSHLNHCNQVLLQKRMNQREIRFLNSVVLDLERRHSFLERFNMAPPRKATLIDWERRAFAFGSGVEGRRCEKKHVLESLLR
ncbi:hypothetical protein C0J52_21327 [Blattella germanica]|nr:hypothetical protein C0J52_21327 [Blattella germanica]